MVELSQLLGMFTGKLQEQQEHVDEIHEAAVGTTVNVEKVNTHAESYHLHHQPLRNCWV
jgi:t-SNARE complex subunit (syntaxin)